MMQKLTAILLAVLMLCGCAGAETVVFDETNDPSASPLVYWAEGESRAAFLDYVAAVTDESSPDYIPETDRLAVFDLDGTLCGEQFPTYFDWMMCVHRILEDPDYEPTEEQLEVARDMLYAVRDGVTPDDLEERQYLCAMELFAGMTIAEYRAYVADFLNTKADRFDDLKLGDAWFRTTVEAARYLQANGFTVYIVSGTDREADRVMIADIIGIPYRQVIGSDCYTVGSGQGDAGYLDYQYSAEDVPVRTAKGVIKNVKSGKPTQMAQELGQQPVIAFGNSTGDFSMFMYTTSGNPYRAMAFCVVPDDGERETARPEKVTALTEACDANGWQVISMKNDFVTIYDPSVTRNGDAMPWLDRMLELLEALDAADAA